MNAAASAELERLNPKETWTFAGEGLRFTGSFHENEKVFAGLWERRSDDGAAWQPWMNVRLVKVE